MSAKKRHRFHRTSYSLRYLVSTQALNVFQDKSEQVIDTSRLQCICASVCVRGTLKATAFIVSSQMTIPSTK